MRHFADGTNLGICTNRQVNSTFQHACVTRSMINDCTLSTATKERTYVFPLWLQPEGAGDGFLGNAEARPNFSSDFLGALRALLPSLQPSAHGLPGELSPVQVAAYIYSILHCPSYRRRYSEQLKNEYPRIPLTAEASTLFELTELGEELVALHLFESPTPGTYTATTTGTGDFQVEKVSYSDETVWLDKAETRGFQGVPEEVWNFQMGGYKVCEKWLKDRQAKGGKNPRPGRVLTDEEIEHYQKIVLALGETLRVMSRIDEVIDASGGWPGAFQANEPNE
jgi:predicted helicase